MSGRSDAQRFGKVAVLFGGRSAERDISLMSGSAVLAALQSQGVDAHKFDPAEKPLTALLDEGYARVFIALHGRFGEDGTLQGALEAFGIPYTGSGVLGSALAMDKWRTKLVWQQSGIPVADGLQLTADMTPQQVIDRLGPDMMVKAAREGSSIGITKIIGGEYTCAVLGERALPMVRIEPPQGNYDYQNKYFTDDTQYFCPAGLDAGLEAHIQALTLRAFHALGCQGWGRADIIITPNGEPVFLEMNTSPGMTGHSLVPMAAKAAGIPFEQLVVEILEGSHVG
ncbi:MAG: D-alanine--D-alanine ligase [Betaproteobacteria bacterium]|nr:D-alanine--D-alanine ligase [Betaproteobacteria bacterium]